MAPPPFSDASVSVAPSRSLAVEAARPIVVIRPSTRVIIRSGRGVVSVRSKPLSESSSGSEIEGLKMAVNDEGKVPSGVPAPVGDGEGEEKKDETDGDAKETPASKVAVDRNTELLLWPSASASSGSSKDTGTE